MVEVEEERRRSKKEEAGAKGYKQLMYRRRFTIVDRLGISDATTGHSSVLPPGDLPAAI